MNENGEKMKTEQITKTSDEMANLKKIAEISNNVHFEIDDLEICSASEDHVKEIAELWANLATIQRLNLPERYSFQGEGKNWQEFVRRKIEKKQNLLLVIKKKGEYEVRGFLYLQSITLPLSDFILKGVIEDIYTKPQYRKQKLATKLLNTALDWANSQNIKQVDFISFERAKDLNGFYNNFSGQQKDNVELKLINL